MDEIETRYSELIEGHRTLAKFAQQSLRELLGTFLQNPTYSLINAQVEQMQKYEKHKLELIKQINLLKHYRATCK